MPKYYRSPVINVLNTPSPRSGKILSGVKCLRFAKNKNIILKRTAGVIIKLVFKLALNCKLLIADIPIIIRKIMKIILVEG